MKSFRMLALLPVRVGATVVALMMTLVPSAALAYDGETSPSLSNTETQPAVECGPEDPLCNQEIPVPTLDVKVQCGPDNDMYLRPETTPHYTLVKNENRSADVTADEGYVFPGEQTSVHFNAPADENISCMVTRQLPKWNTYERRVMRGVCITGHRGMGVGTVAFGGRRYDEDTKASLLKAMHLGACSVETDYQETRDDVSVSQHDPTLQRMTNGFGPIRQRNLGYIRTLRGPTGSRVSTHYEMVKALSQINRSCFQQQEIKQGGFSNEVMARMIKTNDRLVKRPECVLFTSSERSTLGQIARLNKSINDKNNVQAPLYRTGLIIRKVSTCAIISQVQAFVDRIMCDWRSLSARYVQRAHKAGFEVSARNVNTRGILSRVRSWNVDAVVTDSIGSL